MIATKSNVRRPSVMPRKPQNNARPPLVEIEMVPLNTHMLTSEERLALPIDPKKSLEIHTVVKKGNTYTGELNAKGQFEGLGRMVYANGDIYTGQWFTGQKNGVGIMTYTAGQKLYKGHWSDGKKNGMGIMSCAESDASNTTGSFTYQGSFARDEFHGFGKLKFQPLSKHFVTYTGQWQNNKRLGEGEQSTQADNNRCRASSFKAHWESTKYNGEVTLEDE
jgi:hypothetical protein